MQVQDQPLLDPNVVEFIWSMNTPDEDFATELYGIFVDQSALVVDDIEKAVAGGDVNGAKKLAHRLRGSAANLGAKAIAAQAGYIEINAEDPVFVDQQLGAAFTALKDLFQQTRTEIQTMLQQPR